MSKRVILIAFFVFMVAFFNFSSAEECFPSYQCGPWSECEDGLKTRTCVDTECGRPDITERGFCENPDCIPDVVCEPVSECTYTEKADDIIRGEYEIKFKGYRTERCKDKSGCIAAFLRTIPCNEVHELQLSPIEVCDVPLLSVRERASGKQIATIEFNPWIEKGQFNLAFVQGDLPEYCPHCYNAIKDTDKGEINTDCGGPCAPCKSERRWLLYLAIVLFWSGSAIFAFLSVKQYRLLKKPQQTFIDEQ